MFFERYVHERTDQNNRESVERPNINSFVPSRISESLLANRKSRLLNNIFYFLDFIVNVGMRFTCE